MELGRFTKCQYLSQALCLPASKGASALHFAPLTSNGLSLEENEVTLKNTRKDEHMEESHYRTHTRWKQ